MRSVPCTRMRQDGRRVAWRPLLGIGRQNKKRSRFLRSDSSTVPDPVSVCHSVESASRTALALVTRASLLHAVEMPAIDTAMDEQEARGGINHGDIVTARSESYQGAGASRDQTAILAVHAEEPHGATGDAEK